jgi:3-oxoacyl-[acyl-carrier-protein] synthase II
VAIAEHAAREALANAGWTAAECGRDDTGLFVGTSKGAIECWIQPGDLNARAALPLGLAQIDAELSRKLQFGFGPRLTISAACSSGLHALLRATMAIESGEVRRALVVGVEASVHPLFISSFKRLGVLAPEEHGCRPFDRQRRGFVLSEAAGAVCLEAAEKPVGRPIVRIDRWAAGADGTHLTGGDPEGVTLRKLLARVAAPGCDLVHAHATGTIVNDPIELAAIGATSGQTRPYLFSHKGALGHSLGAAGMVAVVLNCLSHLTGKIPANVRSGEPLEMEGLRFLREVVQTPIRRSIAFAAGFGGPLAAVGLVSC